MKGLPPPSLTFVFYLSLHASLSFSLALLALSPSLALSLSLTSHTLALALSPSPHLPPSPPSSTLPFRITSSLSLLSYASSHARLTLSYCG